MGTALMQMHPETVFELPIPFRFPNKIIRDGLISILWMHTVSRQRYNWILIMLHGCSP
jgi:hypothetical protein